MKFFIDFKEQFDKINKTMLVKLKNKKNSYSFTLIELLVVIGIIVILSSVIMVTSGPFREQARDNKRKEDLAAYQNALQIYYSEHKAYPDPETDPCCAPQCLQSYLQNELSPLPQDPLDPNCSGGNYGYYYKSAGGKDYKLYVKLENRNDEAMKNDGGSDPLAYEVFSTFGNQLAVTFNVGGLTVSALSCSIISSEDCDSEGGVKILGLSASINAHAEAPTQASYDYCICCFGPRDLGTDCNASNKAVFLRLSSPTNAHVQEAQ